MPDEFINQEGNDVTDAFVFYARPLLGSGFGSAHKLRAPRAAKLLKKD
jgi:6-phosphofructokinase 1